MPHAPFSIIDKLYPTLIQCARYADLIQHRIVAVPDKLEAKNIFAAALSDADLSIQTSVELGVLSHFPEIPFHGEEYKDSRNTKYLAGINFVDNSEYLITLDPIDGTRLYLDGKKLYQIILAVVSRDSFEAAIVFYPAYGDYIYAMKNKGAFYGNFSAPLTDAKRWQISPGSSKIFLSSEFERHKKELNDYYQEIFSSAWYHKDYELHYVSSALRNELSGAIISNAQIIDGAALSFVAKEMGYLVRTLNNQEMPRPLDYPELIFPGLIVAEDNKCLEILLSIAAIHAGI